MIKNRIPNEGNAENMIQRLRSYIEPVNTAWFQELKSASDENIEKWKKHLGLEEKKLDFPPTLFRVFTVCRRRRWWPF